MPVLLAGSDVNRIARSNLQNGFPFLLNQTFSLFDEEQLNSVVQVPNGTSAGRKEDSVDSRSLILVCLQNDTGQDVSSEMVRINGFQGNLGIQFHRFLIHPLRGLVTPGR